MTAARGVARSHLRVVPNEQTIEPAAPSARRERRWGVYCSDGELWQSGYQERDAELEVEIADLQCNFDGCNGRHEHHPQDPDDVT